MSRARKPTPEEILETLEQQAAEDEAKRILALSDEELDKELADEGFDPKAERAWGRAVAERAVRAPDEGAAEGGAWASVVPIAPQKEAMPRWLLLLVAAVALAVLGGGGAYVAAHWTHHDEEPPRRVVPDPAPNVTPAPPAPRSLLPSLAPCSTARSSGRRRTSAASRGAVLRLAVTPPRRMRSGRPGRPGWRSMSRWRWGTSRRSTRRCSTGSIRCGRRS